MNFMIKFQWDKAKYPTSLTLSSLAEIINKVQAHKKVGMIINDINMTAIYN